MPTHWESGANKIKPNDRVTVITITSHSFMMVWEGNPVQLPYASYIGNERRLREWFWVALIWNRVRIFWPLWSSDDVQFVESDLQLCVVLENSKCFCFVLLLLLFSSSFSSSLSFPYPSQRGSLTFLRVLRASFLAACRLLAEGFWGPRLGNKQLLLVRFVFFAMASVR